FTAALSVLTGILLGLAPALRGTNVDPGFALKAGGGGSGSGRLSTGAGLVILQVAISALLIAGAGLLAITFRNLLQTDPGFDRDRVLTVRIDPRASGYKDGQLSGLYQQIEERVSALPGVQSAVMAEY